MAVVALGLGANLGDPARQLRDALQMIFSRDIAKVTHVSSLWRTRPWGVADQPPFINACVLADTAFAPAALLAALKSIERDIGRTPGPRWGPRAIDIDILFYDDFVVATDALTIPHARLFDRGFVLAPLAEICGERIVSGLRIADALARVDRTGLERIEDARDWPPHPGSMDAVGEHIRLHCADGVEIGAWRAAPTGAPKGGIVVLQEIFGVNHHVRAIASRFADAGYLAIAPNLFDRVEKNVELGYDGSDMSRAMETRGRTKLDDTLRDVASAIGEAATSGPVGIVGYCWGGSLAFAAAARLEGIKGAVGYYGGMIASMIGETPRVPVMLHFGARDAHIPLSDVEKIRDAYPAVPVFVYDADHGFNCDERASFDAVAAQTARERTMTFFDEVLR